MDRERPGLSSAPRRKRRLQDLGLPRNLSPHTGWVGPQTAALALTLPPPQDSRQPFPRRGARWREGRGLRSCPGGGPRTARREHPRTEKCGWGCRTPWIGPTHNDAIAQASSSEQHPAPSTPARAGRPQVRRNQVRAWTQPIAAGLPLRGRRQKSKVQELWESGGVCPASRPGPRGVPLPRAPLRTSLGPLSRPIARSPANEEVGSAGRKLSRVQCLRQIVRF